MNYICKKCHWKGTEQQLDYDDVETCGGDDKIEMCPNCGSYELIIDNKLNKQT